MVVWWRKLKQIASQIGKIGLAIPVKMMFS